MHIICTFQMTNKIFHFHCLKLNPFSPNVHYNLEHTQWFEMISAQYF